MTPSPSISFSLSTFTPIQFGLTYVDSAKFIADFEKSLHNLVVKNYSDTIGNPTDFVGADETYSDGYRISRNHGTLIYDKPVITIGKPVLKILDNSSGGNLVRLFGTYNPPPEFGDSRFKFVVSYKISISLRYGSVTTTPIFNNPIGTVYSGPDTRLQGQTVIWGNPVLYEQEFVLTN